MTKFALAVAGAVVAVGLARADLGPPPGSKYVPVVTTVKLEKSFPDHSFYVVGFGPGATPLTKVELDPAKATKVDAKSRYGGNLYAVPNAVVKEYKTEKELAEAIRKEKPPVGVSSLSIGNRTTLKVSDKRDAIERVLLISAGDEKVGLKIAEEKPDAKDPEKKDPEGPTATAPPGGRLLVVGLAAALALVAGGLWAVRRK